MRLSNLQSGEEKQTVKGLCLYAWYSMLHVTMGLKNKQQDKLIFLVLSA